MHEQVQEFLTKNAHVARWRDADVVEVGALNVNGQARDCIPKAWGGGEWRSWTGIDLIEGDGVDVVGDAINVLWASAHAGELWDIAVCTEVLEHEERWEQLVDSLLTALRPGGVLYLTCAGTGRDAHAADGTTGGPKPGEWYRNVSLTQVLNVIGARATVVCASELHPPGDTRLVAIKAKGSR